MNALQTRKQLLIAESELNRAQMLDDISDLTAGFRVLADRAKSINAMAVSAAALVTGLAAFRRPKTAGPAAKPSWLATILKLASMVSNLWLAFRPPPRDHGGM
jgi:hypothetical protein